MRVSVHLCRAVAKFFFLTSKRPEPDSLHRYLHTLLADANPEPLLPMVDRSRDFLVPGESIGAHQKTERTIPNASVERLHLKVLCRGRPDKTGGPTCSSLRAASFPCPKPRPLAVMFAPLGLVSAPSALRSSGSQRLEGSVAAVREESQAQRNTCASRWARVLLLRQVFGEPLVDHICESFLLVASGMAETGGSAAAAEAVVDAVVAPKPRHF
jgi:hypothetical protein